MPNDIPDTIAGTFPTRTAADQAIAALRAAGFEDQRVRAVPPERVRDGAEPLKLTRRSLWSLVAGILIGAVAAPSLPGRVLIVPPLRDFQVAAMTIVGALTGGAIGWVLGAIAGTHAPVVEEGEYRREAAEHGVGPTVVTVDAHDRVDEAGRILMRYGATLLPGETENGRYEAGPDTSHGAIAKSLAQSRRG